MGLKVACLDHFQSESMRCWCRASSKPTISLLHPFCGCIENYVYCATCGFASREGGREGGKEGGREGGREGGSGRGIREGKRGRGSESEGER
jgi:hypothetical protein